MKVKHTVNVRYLTGKEDHNQVFSPAPSQNFSISRRYVYPKRTSNNTLMGLIMKNLSMVWRTAPVAFIGDGALYSERYYSQNKELPNMGIPARNGFSFFLKICWAIKTQIGSTIDLTTCDADDISAEWDNMFPDNSSLTFYQAAKAGVLAWVDPVDDLHSPLVVA